MFIDPTGLWEVKTDQREILDRKGRGTGKFETYMFFEAQEGDDINSLAKETGLDIGDLQKGLGDTEIKEGTRLEKLGVKSIDRTISSINKFLNNTKSQGNSNCWGCSYSIGMTGVVSLDINGTGTGAIGNPNDADRMLLNDFEQVNRPRFGDIGRFAHPDGNVQYSKSYQQFGYKVISDGKQSGGTSHYATFLLRNKQGVNYFFSKNGGASGDAWQINTTQQLEGRGAYGGLTPIGSGSPFYRKK